MSAWNATRRDLTVGQLRNNLSVNINFFQSARRCGKKDVDTTWLIEGAAEQDVIRPTQPLRLKRREVPTSLVVMLDRAAQAPCRHRFAIAIEDTENVVVARGQETPVFKKRARGSSTFCKAHQTDVKPLEKQSQSI